MNFIEVKILLLLPCIFDLFTEIEVCYSVIKKRDVYYLRSAVARPLDRW